MGRIAKVLFPGAMVWIASLGLHGQIPQGPPTAIESPNLFPNSQNSPVPGQPPVPSIAEAPTPSSPFNYGPLALHPDLSYEIAYETGLEAAPGRTADATVQTLSAGLVVQEGTAWNLSYTPTWVRYSSSLFRDTVDQAASLGANFNYEDWAATFAQSYSRTEDPTIETGRQTREQSFVTDMSGHYGASISKPSLEVTFHQGIRFASLSPSTYDWSNQDWLHFPVSPQCDLAVGPGAGYTHQNPGYDLVYFRPQAQAIWRPGENLSLNAQAGVQETTLLVAHRTHDGTPILSANLTYQPWPTTSVTAGANRQESPSLIPGELSESTTFDVAVKQRLLTHFYLSVEAGSGKTDYLAVRSGLATERGDMTNSLQASLSTVIFHRLNLGLTASQVHNSSTSAAFAFTTDQYGIQVALRY